MANVSITNFQVGRSSGNREFARVAGRVSFTPSERDLNLRFYVRAQLYERDSDLDVYLLGLGSTSRIPRGNSDDYVGYIGATYIRPDGAASREFSFENTWDFGNQEAGNEEYRAIVRAIPDIRGDVAVSNEISANLG